MVDVRCYIHLRWSCWSINWPDIEQVKVNIRNFNWPCMISSPTERLIWTGMEALLRQNLYRQEYHLHEDMTSLNTIIFISKSFFCEQGVLDETEILDHLTKVYSACRPPLCPQSSYYWHLVGNRKVVSKIKKSRGSKSKSVRLWKGWFQQPLLWKWQPTNRWVCTNIPSAFVQKMFCSLPGSNRRPCACEAHVITATLRKPRC